MPDTRHQIKEKGNMMGNHGSTNYEQVLSEAENKLWDKDTIITSFVDMIIHIKIILHQHFSIAKIWNQGRKLQISNNFDPFYFSNRYR